MKKGLSLKELKETGIYYEKLFNQCYWYEINKKYIICLPDGEILFENVDDCTLHQNELFEIVVNDKYSLYQDDGKVLVKDVSLLEVYGDYFLYHNDKGEQIREEIQGIIVL